MQLSNVKQALTEIDRDEFEKLIAEHGEDAIEAAIECNVQLSDFEEAYSGKYDSDKAFAQDMAEQLGSIDKDLAWPYTCIDWEFAAKELMYGRFLFQKFIRRTKCK